MTPFDIAYIIIMVLSFPLIYKSMYGVMMSQYTEWDGLDRFFCFFLSGLLSMLWPLVLVIAAVFKVLVPFLKSLETSVEN